MRPTISPFSNSSRVDITVYQHGKCFIFLNDKPGKEVMKSKVEEKEVDLNQNYYKIQTEIVVGPVSKL